MFLTICLPLVSVHDAYHLQRSTLRITLYEDIILWRILPCCPFAGSPCIDKGQVGQPVVDVASRFDGPSQGHGKIGEMLT